MKQNWRKYFAEFLGTMILVLVGLGAGLVLARKGDITAGLGSALAFGLTLMALVYIIGPISGCNVNPAVSLGLAVRKKLSWKDFGFYVVAQIVGAIVGVAIILGVWKLIMGGVPGAKFEPGSTYSDFAIMGKTVNGLFARLLIDILTGFVFILTILGVIRKTDNKAVAGVVIGLILTALIFVGGSLNPAASLATAIFHCIANTAAIKEVWLFIVGPLVGGALAGIVAGFLFKGEEGAKPAVAKELESSKATKK